MDSLQFKLKMDVRVEAFDAALRRYVDELGLEFPRVVKAQARLANQDLIRLTAPRSYAQGRAAVLRDICRAVNVIDLEKITSDRLRQYVESRNYEAVTAILFAQPKGKFDGYKLLEFDPQLHESVRDSRGRVTKNHKIITLDAKEHKAYVRQVRGHVGYMRGGWAPAAHATGANLPAWVSRHTGGNSGAAINNLSDKKHPSITMINSSRGVSESIGQSRILSMVRRRTSAMVKDVNQVLDGRASRYFT
jgi:hypothetical protein